MDADVGRYTRVKALKGSVHGADDERAALCPASSTPTTSTPPGTASSAASAARAARAVRAVYFCLGAGLLAAWNALITGTDYFGAVYPGWHTDRLFTLAYLPLCMVSLAAAIRYPDVLSLAGRIRLGYAGFTLCMAAVPLLDALLVAPAAAAAPPGGDGGQQPPQPQPQPGEVPAGALVAVLVCVAVVGVCDGLCQGALFGEAAQLPPPYTQAVVAGTASSGLLVCLLRVASKASFEAAAARREGQEGTDAATRAGLRNGTRLYFALAGLLSFACLILYDFVLPPLRRRAGGALAAAAAAQDRDSGSSSSSSTPATAASGNDAAVERQPLLLQLQLPDASSAATLEVELSGDLGSVHGSEAAAAALTGGAPAAAVAAGTVVGAGAGAEVGAAGGDSAALPVSTHANHNHHHHHHHSTNFGSPCAPATTNAISAAAATAAAAAASPSSGSFRSAQLAGCVAASWPVCAGLFAVYGVTLSIFPGFLAEDVHSADLGDWYPILLITAFNAADLVGKTLPCVTPLPPTSAPSALAPSSSGSGPGSLAQRSAAKGRAAAAAAEGAAGRGQGLAARLAAAMLMPLRRPRGMLAASLVRGAVALPAFVAAAAWQAPAAVMAALTVLLGVSNGYLTSQLMTMGPSAVLPRPLLDSGASDDDDEEEDGIGGDCERGCEEAGAEEAGEETTGGRGAVGMEEGRGRGIGAGLGRGLVGGGGGGGGVEGYVALPAAAVVAGTASALVDSGGGGGGGKAGSAGKARRQQQQRKEPSSHYQEPNHEHHHHTHHADAEVVENLLVLSLVAGLNVGAVLGWLWLV